MTTAAIWTASSSTAFSEALASSLVTRSLRWSSPCQAHGVVEPPPFWSSLCFAVLGAMDGIVVVVAVVASWFCLRYRVRGGDPNFTPEARHPQGSVFPFGLTCVGGFDATQLGTFEAWLERPDGNVERCDLLTGEPLQDPTRFFFVVNDYPSGRCRLRWYVTPPGGRQTEVRRAVISHPVYVPGDRRSGRLIPPGRFRS